MHSCQTILTVLNCDVIGMSIYSMYCDVVVYAYLDCSSGLFYEPCVFTSQSSYMFVSFGQKWVSRKHWFLQQGCPQEQVSLQGYVRLALLYSAEQYGFTSPSCVHATGSHYCTGWTWLQFKSNITSLPFTHAPVRLSWALCKVSTSVFSWTIWFHKPIMCACYR